ncbi:MAG: hypothetical protein K2N14_03415, partial [Clostridia bacterium]|nr:hypothetical protein [Clostridia bacterium]
YLESAEELDDKNGELHALKLVTYTKTLTDYAQIIPAGECAEGVKEYTSAERKEELLKAAAPSLEENIASMRSEIKEMNRENEEKKAERAVKFKKDAKTAGIVFGALFAVLAVFAALTGYFASIIYTVSTGLYLILTCVFGGLTFIALIAVAVAARFLNITCRRIRLNKRNTSTQLGRDLLVKQSQLKAFLAVYSALKGE